MVGVGTNKARLEMTGFHSLLGRDQESWGFSYKGNLYHNGETRQYSQGFTQGSIVGIHHDSWKGTLQFFLDKRPLGLAFVGLQNKELYPMASSSAAQSGMRLIHSSSMPVSLQLECLSSLTQTQRDYLRATFPALRYLSDGPFADILQKETSKF